MAWATSPAQSIAPVTTSSSTVTTSTITTTATASAPTLLVCFISNNASGTAPTTMSDSNGGTWTLLGSTANGSTNSIFMYGRLVVTASEAFTVTVAGTSYAAAVTVAFEEWATARRDGIVSDVAAVTSSGTGTSASATIVPVTAGDLVLLQIGWTGTTTTVGTPTTVTIDTTVKATKGVTGYFKDTSTGSISPAITLGASRTWLSLAVALKTAATAGMLGVL